jgi:hypothetical protein
MIEIAGTQFPLTFKPQMAGRELVLLGVIPIGAIERQATGRYAWSIDLPIRLSIARADVSSIRSRISYAWALAIEGTSHVECR